MCVYHVWGLCVYVLKEELERTWKVKVVPVVTNSSFSMYAHTLDTHIHTEACDSQAETVALTDPRSNNSPLSRTVQC